MFNFRILLTAIALTVCANSLAQTTCAGLAANEVVDRQLVALRDNDEPVPDAGIARTWEFAHPANRRYTGPLPRFTDMLKSPAYRGLLGHRSHDVEELGRDTKRAVFLVTVQSNTNRALGFRWTLEKVKDGEYANCWMTTNVSPQVTLGEII